ncbi:MAG: 16S rRNA (cytidine(1402)-2'-O)-methyltransferase [Silicimonas sp.]|nr:16S rRNA (cytidine(1402)-2'-O)-methyltransferase [Silicimonas sp.]
MSDDFSPRPLDPGLYFIATPLGNARDITLRALDILKTAEVLAAEDTRSLRRLMEIHGVPLQGRRIIAYHDHNGARARPGLLAALREGRTVAYASEAGSPLVADPGFQLAKAAIDEDLPVFSAPGPSAVIAALSVAGLPSDRFTFAGFPPNAQGARRKFLESLKSVPGTLILYESPARLEATLKAAVDVLGAERPAAVCRELTKKFEEVIRGTLVDVLSEIEGRKLKGEIALCIGAGDQVADPAEIEAALRVAMKTQKLKDAAKEVSEKFGVSKRDLYQLGLSFEGS